MEPWRLDGWPADCRDPAVLGYWAETAQEVQYVRTRADAYLHALPDQVRTELGKAARRRVLLAHQRQEI